MNPAPLLSPTAPRAEFQNLTDLRREHTELLKEYHSRGSAPEILDALRDFVTRGRKLGTLLDRAEERIEAQRILDQWGTVVFKAARATGDESVDTTLEECEGKDLDYFFGREALRDRAFRIIEAQRLIAVLGPSGSGKSSFVSGGLLPALRAGAVLGSERWIYVAGIIPGAEPLQSLIDGLRAAAPGGAPPPPAADCVQSEPVALPEWLENAFGGRVLLIFIDQFEETFIVCRREEARASFAAAICALVDYASQAHRVIFSMRSDLDPCLNGLTALRERLSEAEEKENIVRLKPLGRADLTAAIERPANAVGLRFHPEAVEVLINDVENESAALPLLQFTLRALWQKCVVQQKSDRVTLPDYQDLGGAKGALAAAAESVFATLGMADQAAARDLFLQLFRIGGAGQITSVQMPMPDSEKNSALRNAADSFLQQYVLRTSQASEGTSIQVVHESLARGWHRLAGWLEEARGPLLQRRRFEELNTEWLRLGSGPAGLLDAAQLAAAEAWILTPAAQAFGHPGPPRAAAPRQPWAH